MFYVIAMSSDNWGFIETTYVLVQIFTTIGYGDFTVSNWWTKLFMAFYVIMCLVALAYVCNLMCQNIMDKSGQYLRAHLRRLEGACDEASHSHIKITLGDRNEAISATVIFIVFIAIGMVFFRFVEHCTCSYGLTKVEGCRENDFDTCRDTGGYVKNWDDAFYVSVITLTTVGFGDMSPKTRTGRVFAIFWMWLGVGACIKWLNAMCKYFFEFDTGRKHKWKADINPDIFDTMDKDNKGYLTRADYRGYVLVQYGLVDQEILDCIDSHFDKLDTDRKNRVTLDMIQQNMDVYHPENLN